MQRPTQSLSVPSLVDALQAAIREQILTGELPGGAPLTEVDLATQYSVARPTAKAALERLVHDGLLTRASNKTARVPILSADDIRDLYFSRAFLERQVVEWLAEHRLVPDAARASVQAMEPLTTEPILTEVVRLDIAFHTSLLAALGSRRMSRMYESLMGEVHLCMAQVQAHHLGSPRRIAADHRAILTAIEDGAADRARAEISDHLDRACSGLLAHLTKIAGPPRA
jgi:DNA-binding GntR family transcriptional regulator